MAGKLASVQAAAAVMSEGFSGEVRGEMLHVKPLRDWPVSAYSLIQRSDFDGWASKCLVGDDYEIWQRLDPTIGELDELFEEVGSQLGISLGK